MGNFRGFACNILMQSFHQNVEPLVNAKPSAEGIAPNMHLNTRAKLARFESSNKPYADCAFEAGHHKKILDLQNKFSVHTRRIGKHLFKVAVVIRYDGYCVGKCYNVNKCETKLPWNNL